MKIYACASSRVSIFGGGTDVNPYTKEYGGAVINMAINIRQHIILRSDNNLWEYPYSTFPYQANPEFMYAVLKRYGINGMSHSSIESNYDGKIGAGLGSSAAAAVALIGACRRRLNKELDLHGMAKEAWEVEIEDMGWWGGIQDQYASLFGGLNYLTIYDFVGVSPIPRQQAHTLQKQFLLFYVGGNRQSGKLQNGFKSLTKKKKKTLDNLKEIANCMYEKINCEDWRAIASALQDTWKLKKESNKGVTNRKIDAIYDYAIKNGARAGKILGAGGAGYMVFMVDPEKQKYFISKMMDKGIENVDYSIDFNGLETRIL